MIECTACNGTGIDFASLDCDKCNGAGEINPYAHFYDGEEGLEGFYDEE